jgi:hypothetical protein
MRRTDRSQSDVQHRLRHDVHLILHDGHARLMDLQRGQFFTLDAIGAEMLTLALERSPRELVSIIAQAYGANPDQVRADWARLSGELRRDGLIEVVARPFNPGVVPGRMRLFFLLALAWLCLRLFGWAGTIRLWRRGTRLISGTRSAVAIRDVVETVGRAVQDAAAQHVLNAECKERSLVAWRILCEQFGLPATIVVGAIPYPFQAHAWVECGPWTITDERANCDAYIAVARFS